MNKEAGRSWMDSFHISFPERDWKFLSFYENRRSGKYISYIALATIFVW